ncbi:hypothetical protein IC757_01045 [Wenzhouxiangella sp. AB-CW3]|uniref:hypothetical protein n=1 Tax=Wenzhouxiangella sp. AB-CW3 TaxID=2771012 RepID=UPI00168B3576|nr:hypothetical protein [Wenzhouxiangella sp. AB-CW3]QOC22784.1 hypothetical protein IC757_01045 [Wenzhouxiangella sp. AB-CW3]
MTESLFRRWLSLWRSDRELHGTALQRSLRREQMLVASFARLMPGVPLLPDRSGEDDSVLGRAGFAGLQARPTRIVACSSSAVCYVALRFQYHSSPGRFRIFNTGRVRIYARIEDPLYRQRRRHDVAEVRRDAELRSGYFERVFMLLNAHGQGSSAVADWMAQWLPDGGEVAARDLQAAVQNFDHSMTLDGRAERCNREPFRQAMRHFDFEAGTPPSGPVSLRLCLRPHRQPDGHYRQSLLTLFLGNRRGPAFRGRDGRVRFLPPGDAFEARFNALAESRVRDRLISIGKPSYRKTAEQRIWGAGEECAACFHNLDHFVMQGRRWMLERMADGMPAMRGHHRNVAVYRSERHRVAVKAVPFESVGDLVRLIQAHQYVHTVQAPALLDRARHGKALARDIIAGTLTALHAERPATDTPDAPWPEYPPAPSPRQFLRHLGPLLHQVWVDDEYKLLLAVTDWNADGMLSDFDARRRLVEDCPLSYRLRMAANLMRNGHRLLADDVTHTDLKPENILNCPGPAFAAQRKAREQGWERLSDAEVRAIAEGEAMLEGDHSGIYFGREGGVDNIKPGEGLPTSLAYSNWRFTGLGLTRGLRPTHLKVARDDRPGLDALVLEQDVANRGATAWEIVYGGLEDCIPSSRWQQRQAARDTAQMRVATCLDQAIALRRSGRKDPEVIQSLERAMCDCDRRLLDLVSLRSECIEHKRCLSPLFQQARDNRHGHAVWIDPRVIDMLDHLACDTRHPDLDRQRAAKLYRTAETLFRAEATRLETADYQTACIRRLKLVSYMNSRRLHFNPDSGLLGLADIEQQLARLNALVESMSDPRHALAGFAAAWQRARQWGFSVIETVAELRAEQDDADSDFVADAVPAPEARSALLELARSTLMREHARQQREESREDEQRIRPPHLGLLEPRRPRLYQKHGETCRGYTLGQGTTMAGSGVNPDSVEV